ncbi:hypothetical protein [Biomaibacter acetigenes]|uniref:hypothetical protein n=1 Tax=Biomaibacter acetigenes TaxID=2316383 RepID=UPI0013CE73EF|nr:hypothetical protein [Biomaibacter acetigenes]
MEKYQVEFKQQIKIAEKIIRLLEDENVKIADVPKICEKVISLSGKSPVKWTEID